MSKRGDLDCQLLLRDPQLSTLFLPECRERHTSRHTHTCTQHTYVQTEICTLKYTHTYIRYMHAKTPDHILRYTNDTHRDIHTFTLLRTCRNTLAVARTDTALCPPTLHLRLEEHSLTSGFCIGHGCSTLMSAHTCIWSFLCCTCLHITSGI